MATEADVWVVFFFGFKEQVRVSFSFLVQQVIQRRDDFDDLRENRENFNRDWEDYKSGFGDPDREFWLGNENIYMLTNAEDYSLRVELEDFEGNKRYTVHRLSSTAGLTAGFLPEFTGFYWVLLGFTGFYLVLLGFT